MTPYQLRAAFARTMFCGARDMGLRAIRDALALKGRNPSREAELLGRARMLLAEAQARTEAEPRRIALLQASASR